MAKKNKAFQSTERLQEKEHCITEPELQMPMESRSAYMRPPVKNYMKSSWKAGDRWRKSSFAGSIRRLPSIVRNGC